MDNIFWIISKIVWNLMAPETLLLFLLIFGVSLLWTRRNKSGRFIITATVAIVHVEKIVEEKPAEGEEAEAALAEGSEAPPSGEGASEGTKAEKK